MSKETSGARDSHSFAQADLDFLLDYLDSVGPSGFEDAAAEMWRRRAEAIGFEKVEQDSSGNSYAWLSGSGRRIMLCGHVDEIGLIVTRVDDKGFLRCAAIGGWDTGVLLGQRVRIAPEGGQYVYGTLTRVAVHELDESAGGKTPKLKDLWIDIGAGSKDEALALVSVGSPATLDWSPRWLNERRLVSKAIDNRVGSFVVLEALRRLKDSGFESAEVVAVASVGEEIGGRGARVASHRLAPDFALNVDVTTPGDTPGGESIGDLKIGGGPIVTRGASTSNDLVQTVVNAASNAEIEVQLRGMGVRTRTDADQITMAGRGVPTALVSVPCRYLHTPCEHCDVLDIDDVVSVLVATVKELAVMEDGK